MLWCYNHVNLGQVGIEHHLDPADGIYPRFEQGFVDEWELCNGQFISFSCHNNPLLARHVRTLKNGFKCVCIADAIRVCLYLGCSCGAVGEGLPRRYLAPVLASTLE